MGIITVVQWAGSESVILGPPQYVGLMVAGTAGELERGGCEGNEICNACVTS